MDPRIIVILIVVLIPALAYLFRRTRRVRSRRLLQALWGRPAEPIERDILEDIDYYWRMRRSAAPQKLFVDDQTWNDLDMDEVFMRLNRTVSVPGGEALYAMLRETGATCADLDARERRVKRFGESEQLRLDVQQALLRVGKSHFHGAARYLYRADLMMPSSWPVYYVLAIAMIALITAGFIWPLVFFAAALLGIVNMVVFYVTDLRWRREKSAVRHIASVLNAARVLSRLEEEALAGECAMLRACVDELRPVRMWFSLFAMDRAGPLDILTEYLKVLFLIDMVSLCAITRGIRRHEQALREAYALVGELDADIAVAALRETTKVHCTPEFHAGFCVEAKGLAHPLIDDPVRNDLDWRGCALLTGSNASGKSTFIKAVAINCILAQTIHTCFAERFALPRALVMSSMAVRDSVVGGESYFVAEIKSLKRLMEAVSDDVPLLAFIDEILRGTNTVERIAAACSVLRAFVTQNVLYMAATHDIELTRILNAVCDNWHFREEVTAEGIAFSYRLHSGPAASRNAIALLEQMGFEESIIQSARAMIKAFEQDGRWPLS